MGWKSKEIEKIWKKKYYLEHKEKICKQQKAYNEKHKEQKKAVARIYQEKNRDKINQKKKDYYQRTKNTIFKAYTERNKIRINKNRKLQYLKNKQRENIIHKQWYLRNRYVEIKKASIRAKQAYLENPGKILDSNKRTYNKYKKIILKKQKAYYESHREQHALTQKKWAERHPEKLLQYSITQLTKLGLEFKLPRLEYQTALQVWTKTVRKILGGLCLICGSDKGVNIHHIFYKSKYPKLSLNPNNGIPLCKIHHLEVHGMRPR